MELKNTLLWLDDLRPPEFWVKDIEQYSEVIWCKDYDDFTGWILAEGLPDVISFDHDLATEHYVLLGSDPALPEAYNIDYDSFEERTGLDCAKWLVDYCNELRLPLPKWMVHSANYHGRQNIIAYLTNASKHLLIP